MRMRAPLTAVALAAAVLLGPAAMSDGASSARVNLNSTTFSPTKVTITKNGTVTFKWKSGAHNLLFAKSAGVKNQSSVVTDKTIRRTFKKKGTFQFVCTVHGGRLGKSGGMSGKVVVK